MIYENISLWCAKRGLTIRQLESKADLGNGTVGKWKNAKPNYESLQKVAEVLGISVSTLIRENKES